MSPKEKLNPLQLHPKEIIRNIKAVVGNKKVIVQAPYLKDSEIKEACKRIKNEYEAKERFIFEPLINEIKEVQKGAEEEAVQTITKDKFKNDKEKKPNPDNSKGH